MANIYLGNTQLGGGGIVPTNALPTANAENYDKHELYLNGGELKYLDKYYSDDFTYNGDYWYGPQYTDVDVSQYITVGDYIYVLLEGNSLRRFDSVAKTLTTLVSLENTSTNIDGLANVEGDYIYLSCSHTYIYKYNYKTNQLAILSQFQDYGYGSLNCNCGSAIYNGYLYTFGGKNGTNDNIGYIFKYSLETGVRSRVGSLVITDAQKTLSYKYGNIVYIFVYSKSTNKIDANEIWKFDLTNETLTQTQLALPIMIGNYQLCEFNGKLYIVGGQESTNTYKGVITFDAQTETFTTLTNQLGSSYNYKRAGCGYHENNIYLLFGRREQYSSKTRYVSELKFPEVIEYKTLASTDLVNTISFTIAGATYQAEEGMTWSEWVNSAYNTDGFRNEGQKIVNSSFTRAVTYNNVYVSNNDVIIDSGVYTLKNYGG